MEEKIRRSLREPVQAFPRDLAEKAGTRTKKIGMKREGRGRGGRGEKETLGRLRVTMKANVIFKLRISQNRKQADENCPVQF